MLVLAIESTCDETGCAIAHSASSAPSSLLGMSVQIISDVKASSADILSKYGGIVPEVAAREQVAAIIPVIETAMSNAKLMKDGKLSLDKLDAIAVTEGPGLIGSLLIGVETAKSLALAWNKPLIGVNHMAAHVFANWIVDGESVPELPAIALVVSGGHTDIIYLSDLVNWKRVGGTRDDAAGEAFDKAARTLGLPYPGGPVLAKKASEISPETITPAKFRLPRPMIDINSLEMSFSGLKTALIQIVSTNPDKLSSEDTALLAREFNTAVVDVLVNKIEKAVDEFHPRSILLAGGVAANQLLRKRLKDKAESLKLKLFVPDLKYCTDNAAMVAAAALIRPNYIDPLTLKPNSSLKLG